MYCTVFRVRARISVVLFLFPFSVSILRIGNVVSHRIGSPLFGWHSLCDGMWRLCDRLAMTHKNLLSSPFFSGLPHARTKYSWNACIDSYDQFQCHVNTVVVKKRGFCNFTLKHPLLTHSPLLSLSSLCSQSSSLNRAIFIKRFLLSNRHIYTSGNQKTHIPFRK